MTIDLDPAVQSPPVEPAAAPPAPAHVRDALRSLLESAAAGSLMGSVVHAGNNRLTVILSCLDLLNGANVADEDLRSAIALASGAAQQLADDFATLLGGVRRRAPPAGTVELGAALQRARSLDAVLHGRALPGPCDVADGVEVGADPDQLVATLLRLYVFARRRGAGAVRVRVRALEVEARSADRPYLRKGRYAHLEFALEGAELPPALSRPPAEYGHVVGRLADPDGLEFAAIEAFTGALRGHLQATTAAVELFLPAPPRVL